jgi:hypothetical protein
MDAKRRIAPHAAKAGMCATSAEKALIERIAPRSSQGVLTASRPRVRVSDEL